MSGYITIDLSENSKDPCKDLMINYFKCIKGKPEEEQKKCFHFASDYLDCRTDPKKLKEMIRERSIKK